MPVYFGNRIRSARKAAGLTQRQLADHLDVSHTSVSNWEKDLSRPDADTIQLLCDLLGVAPNYFYGSSESSSTRAAVSDDDIKFALFGGSGEITDAMYDEVKRFAAFLKAREAGSKE